MAHKKAATTSGTVFRLLVSIQKEEELPRRTQILDEVDLGCFDTEEEAEDALDELLDSAGYTEDDDSEKE